MNLIRKAVNHNFNPSFILAYIKRRCVNYLTKMMCYAGFYVEKLPSAESFYNKLKSYPVAIKEDELRRFTFFLRRANHHNLYNQVLHKFVSQVDFDFDYTEFTGAGNGATTLQVYRKMVVDNDALFEKVYFNSSLDIYRVKWFYGNIYSLMGAISNLRAPNLFKCIEGELITVVYFQFVDLVVLNQKEHDTTIFNLSRQLYELSQTSDVKSKIEQAPSFMKDYTAHFEYIRKIDKAREKVVELLGEHYPLKNIERRINNSPIVLTHGDIHKGNVFKNNYLIDWDSFAIYPIGLEVAYILLFLKRCKLSYKELNNILETEYRATILEEEWDDFELNCLYFYFVFTVQPFTEIDLSQMQYDVLDRIEELYNKREYAVQGFY